MIEEIKKTLNFYDRHARELALKYRRSTPKELHEFILKTLPDKNCKILEIGFGAGREINFLLNNGFKIWGVDGSREFVKMARKNFPEISNKLFLGYLPNLKLPNKYTKFFDAVLSIAVLMHIPKNFHETTAKNIAKYLKPGGILILSYCINARNNEERFFEVLTPAEVQKAFSNAGFKKFNQIVSNDAQGRNLQWITEAYKLIEG